MFHGEGLGISAMKENRTSPRGLLGFTAGCALGAVAMYLGDPHRGAARRALVRDKALHYQRVLRHKTVHLGKDLWYRSKGMAARTRSRLLPQRVADDILLARISSRLGRVIWNPHRFELLANNGKVTITGRILPRELELLKATIHSTPGVRELDSRLEIVKSTRTS